MLAADQASVPMNLGAILIFDGAGPTPAEVRALLHERVPHVPRLRQTLRRTPFGCGRPIWVDDPTFSVDRHLTHLRWPEPGTRRALFDIAADLLCRPFAPDLPLWQAYSVTGIGHTALVVVLHHVLADGLGGLAVLAALTDEGNRATVVRFPLPPPSTRELAVEATSAKLHAIGSLPADLRRGCAGLRELTFGMPLLRPAERISLVRPTAHRRRLASTAVALNEVAATGHRFGGTVNDVVLAAVTGALLEILDARGERPHRLVVSIPVSGRHTATVTDLGNDTGVRPLAVPAITDDPARLTAIVTATTAARASSTRAASSSPLGLTFRLLHRLGLFRLFIDHQRLVHSFETNLRGPGAALRLAGHRIDALVPLVATPGNVGVTFAVLSYAGTLTVNTIADPDILPEQDTLIRALHTIFTRLAHTWP
ncbi:wax ester/triacylglycerol synthase domain-containing protein [Nocardia sp. NPDC051981]|uniref:wax ester/triacylglycerol synthase domain-containing protein n=1 Tax=Nocardia sp. NPDC051981 TaxID=3155417 RepID=UPI003446211D